MVSSRERNYPGHQISMHGGGATNATSATAATELPIAKDDRLATPPTEAEKLIKCGYCSRMFNKGSMKSLYEHIQTVHGKLKKKIWP